MTQRVFGCASAYTCRYENKPYTNDKAVLIPAPHCTASRPIAQCLPTAPWPPRFWLTWDLCSDSSQEEAHCSAVSKVCCPVHDRPAVVLCCTRSWGWSGWLACQVEADAPLVLPSCQTELGMLGRVQSTRTHLKFAFGSVRQHSWGPDLKMVWKGWCPAVLLALLSCLGTSHLIRPPQPGTAVIRSKDPVQSCL